MKVLKRHFLKQNGDFLIVIPKKCCGMCSRVPPAGRYKRRRLKGRKEDDPLRKVQVLSGSLVKPKERKKSVFNFVWDPATGRKSVKQKSKRIKDINKGMSLILLTISLNYVQYI